MDLKNRVALVTGGRRGIGRAIVQRLAAAGASIVIAAQTLEDEGIEDALALARDAGARADVMAFNLADPVERIGAIARAAEYFGPIDILVNNAALNNFAPPSIMDQPFRHMMFEIIVHGPIDLIQQCLPAMRERGFGRILNISSATAKAPPIPYAIPAYLVHGCVVYGGAKAAMDRYTTGLAAELAGTNIRVNAVMPTNSCMTHVVTPESLEILRVHPDWVEGVEMMAEAAMLLICSPLTGRVMPSRDVLQMMEAPLHALDGKTVIGDASTLPDLG
jgi:NAD(P)-dependent dehydrogenase (short-subunit alcohol dehydrogenase family)